MLEGKTILIGKEPGNGRLLIAVKGGSSVKTAVIGEIGCVPGSVSRCKPAEDVGHCKLTIDQNSIMTLINLKPQNVTYVNDIEISSKRITADSRVSLGKDRYVINICNVLEISKKLIGQESQKQVDALSIKHLERVWNTYEKRLETMAYKQQKRSRDMRLPMILGSVSTTITTLLAVIVSTKTLAITLPISVVGTFLYVKSFVEKDTSIEDKKKAKDYLIDNYVCPHANCKRFLGYSEYKILRQNKICPFCRQGFKD